MHKIQHGSVSVNLFLHYMNRSFPNYKKGSVIQYCFSNFTALWRHLLLPFSSVQSLSRVRHFATPWTSFSITNSRSLLKLMSMESVMPSNHLICCPLLLLPSVFPSIRVFSNESVLHTKWTKYWSFSFSINPSNEYSGLISFRME